MLSVFNKYISKASQGTLKNLNIFNRKYQLINYSKMFYHPVRELMKKNQPKYYSDPVEVGEEIIRIISLHDKVKDPSKVTLGCTFEDIGLDSLDFIECILQIELEFGYGFGPSDWEQFITINDIAQFLARDFFAEKH